MLKDDITFPNITATSTGYSGTMKEIHDQLDHVLDMMSESEMNIGSYFRLHDIMASIDIYSVGVAINMSITQMLKHSSLSSADIACQSKLIKLTHKMFNQNILKRISPYRAFMEYVSIIRDVYKIDLSDKLIMCHILIPEPSRELVISSSSCNLYYPSYYVVTYDEDIVEAVFTDYIVARDYVRKRGQEEKNRKYRLAGNISGS